MEGLPVLAVWQAVLRPAWPYCCSLSAFTCIVSSWSDAAAAIALDMSVSGAGSPLHVAVLHTAPHMTLVASAALQVCACWQQPRGQTCWMQLCCALAGWTA